MILLLIILQGAKSMVIPVKDPIKQLCQTSHLPVDDWDDNARVETNSVRLWMNYAYGWLLAATFSRLHFSVAFSVLQPEMRMGTSSASSNLVMRVQKVIRLAKPFAFKVDDRSITVYNDRPKQIGDCIWSYLGNYYWTPITAYMGCLTRDLTEW